MAAPPWMAEPGLWGAQPGAAELGLTPELNTRNPPVHTNPSAGDNRKGTMIPPFPASFSSDSSAR